MRTNGDEDMAKMLEPAADAVKSTPAHVLEKLGAIVLEAEHLAENGRLANEIDRLLIAIDGVTDASPALRRSVREQVRDLKA